MHARTHTCTHIAHSWHTGAQTRTSDGISNVHPGATQRPHGLKFHSHTHLHAGACVHTHAHTHTTTMVFTFKLKGTNLAYNFRTFTHACGYKQIANIWNRGRICRVFDSWRAHFTCSYAHACGCKVSKYERRRKRFVGVQAYEGCVRELERQACLFVCVWPNVVRPLTLSILLLLLQMKSDVKRWASTSYLQKPSSLVSYSEPGVMWPGNRVSNQIRNSSLMPNLGETD